MRTAKERRVCATVQIFSKKKGYSHHALLFLTNVLCSEDVNVPLRNQKKHKHQKLKSTNPPPQPSNVKKKVYWKKNKQIYILSRDTKFREYKFQVKK